VNLLGTRIHKAHREILYADIYGQEHHTIKEVRYNFK
jgi:hypothetical protein